MNKALTVAERDSILEGVDAAIATTQVGLQIMKDWAEKNMEDINKFAVFPTGYFGLTTPENGLELYDGNVRLISREGAELERFPIANYLDYHPGTCRTVVVSQVPLLQEDGLSRWRLSRRSAGTLEPRREDRYSAGK